MTKGGIVRRQASRVATLEVAIAGFDKASRRFAEAWRASEQGKTPRAARERLLFADLPTLLRALTPRRWSLLRDLRRLGSASVRALARAQDRDYKSVHTDVRELERLGLVARGEDGRVSVPWSRITAEFDLAA